jgi:hypothetical protein
MTPGIRSASSSLFLRQHTTRLRVALVLLALTLMVLFAGCGLRNHNGATGQSAQQPTGQQSGGSPTQGSGSGGAAQQIQNADQQIQGAMQGIDSAENAADNANNQAGQEGNIVP